MVVFPTLDEMTNDKSKPSNLNMTHAQLARMALSQLTLRQVHKHFSEKFGDIHRIYVGRDYNQLHKDSVKMLSCIRKEQSL